MASLKLEIQKLRGPGRWQLDWRRQLAIMLAPPPTGELGPPASSGGSFSNFIKALPGQTPCASRQQLAQSLGGGCLIWAQRLQILSELPGAGLLRRRLLASSSSPRAWLGALSHPVRTHSRAPTGALALAKLPLDGGPNDN